MKKVILVLTGLGLLSACDPTHAPKSKPCTIKGHDCWEVAQAAKHQNKDLLQEWGIVAAPTRVFWDGGSRTYTLNDGSSIHFNYKASLPDSERGSVSILQDGIWFFYNNRGQLIRK